MKSTREYWPGSEFTMRQLYLFDIDGTLLSPGPVPRRALNESIVEHTGMDPDLQLKDVAGFTDPLIIRNTLRKLNVINGDITPLVETILQGYLSRIKKEYPTSEEPFVFADTLVLLERVETAGHATGLLTGNVRTGARIKLDRFGLFDRFPFGVFGDDAEERTDLPWIARERAWDVLSESFQFRDMIIVGDAPNDARVATENGARSIIVCRHPEWREQILAAGGDIIVDRLDDPTIEIPLVQSFRTGM